jgi:translation initiation factor 2 subunit 1
MQTSQAEKIPQVDELVLITIKKIMPYGAFCTLDEYNGKEAFIHISEVAPRWIKNIHEFLHEGQKLVAKVYHVDEKKDQIDLSLKRVTDSERKMKLEESRKEKRAQKLFDVAVKLAKSTKAESDYAYQKLTETYGDIISAMEAIAEKGEEAFKDLKIEKGLVQSLLEITSKNMKKAKVELKEIIGLSCVEPDGIDRIKAILTNFEKPKDCEVEIHYLGAPKYQLKVIADDFKIAEKSMQHISESLQNLAKKYNAFLAIEKT